MSCSVPPFMLRLHHCSKLYSSLAAAGNWMQLRMKMGMSAPVEQTVLYVLSMDWGKMWRKFLRDTALPCVEDMGEIRVGGFRWWQDSDWQICSLEGLIIMPYCNR